MSADEGTVELHDGPAGGLDAVVRLPAAVMKNAQNPARDLSLHRA